MANIISRQELEAWLKGRTREEAVAIASRVALRVLPVIGLRIEQIKTLQNWRGVIILPTLRCLVISAAVARYPASEMEAAAYAASHAVNATDAASCAADAASYGASNAAAGAASNAVAHASFDASAARAAASAANIWESVSDDVAWLEEGRFPVLMAQPLWLNGLPQWAKEGWEALRHALLENAPHWRPLAQWVDDRNKGDEWAASQSRPTLPELERERALISDDDWNKGAKHVCGLIAEMEARHWGNGGKSKKPVCLPFPRRAPLPLNQNGGTASWSCRKARRKQLFRRTSCTRRCRP